MSSHSLSFRTSQPKQRSREPRLAAEQLIKIDSDTWQIRRPNNPAAVYGFGVRTVQLADPGCERVVIGVQQPDFQVATPAVFRHLFCTIRTTSRARPNLYE